MLDVVDDFGFGKWPGSTDGIELLPVNRAFVTAPAQPIPPRAFSVPEDNGKHLKVTPNSVVLIMALQFLAQNPVLFPKRQVPVSAAPPPQVLGKPEKSFPCCLPIDHPVTST